MTDPARTDDAEALPPAPADPAVPTATAVELAEELAETRRELEVARAQLAHLSLTDPLTGLANRRALEAALEAELRRLDRRPSPLALVVLDIDHLAKVNELYGREQGDQTIEAVGRALRRVARGSDLVARHGGQEFAVALYDCTLRGAEGWAERFRAALTEISAPGLLTTVTASFGVAAAARADSPASLLDRAERACYQAKRAGRDRVVTAALLSAGDTSARSREARSVA